MKINLPYFLLLLGIFNACTTQPYYTARQPVKTSIGQDDLRPANAQPGKCYGKSYLPDVYATQWVSYPVYTGTESNVPVEYRELMVMPSKTEWKRNDRGEICLVETPAVTQKIAVLSDTVRYRDFRFQMFEYKVLTQKRGYKEFVEIVCRERLSKNMILNISAALMSQGYISRASDQWSQQLSEALTSYQRSNFLPIGGLDNETLASLGIKMP